MSGDTFIFQDLYSKRVYLRGFLLGAPIYHIYMFNNGLGWYPVGKSISDFLSIGLPGRLEEVCVVAIRVPSQNKKLAIIKKDVKIKKGFGFNVSQLYSAFSFSLLFIKEKLPKF